MLGDAIRVVDDFVHQLRSAKNANGSVDLRCEQAANLIDLLLKERDEARMDICNFQRHFHPMSRKTAEEYAQEFRWDCYIRKELESTYHKKYYANENNNG